MPWLTTEPLPGCDPPLKARAGLHVGPVILRENTSSDVALGAKPLEVDGLAKPTAARVMSLAQGGQTLLTAEAREALGETRLRLRSHGHWRIKGVREPLELFEVGDADSPFAAPPDGDKVHRVVRSGDHWLPVRQIAHNLPQQVSSFVGRERELAEVKELLDSVRLLTLLGMGGLGKTRLSLRVVADVMYEYPDGVWFVDLAPLRDRTLVASEAAKVLGVREERGIPLVQALCAHLKSQNLLLILDNCEHLIEPAAELAHAILQAAPGVRIVATSREALRIPGEQTYPVLPLPVPDRADGLDLLSRSAAVRLFVERARLHRPAFSLGEREAPAVVELVARLEGIPLAIELAAARVRSLTVAEINAHLEDRYRLLTGGSRVALERHQTLRSLIDWSFGLLQVAEQALLCRLSVFAGGWTLGAAALVCDGEGVDDWAMLDLLTALVDKSLISAQERDGGTRYRMLETLRQYARDRLRERAEPAQWQRRHLACFLALAEEAEPQLTGVDQRAWLERLEAEHDNLRAGLEWAGTAQGDAGSGLRMAAALWRFWSVRGYLDEGRRSLAELLEAAPVARLPKATHAKALYGAGVLTWQQGDYAQARMLHEEGLSLRRELGDALGIAASLNSLGNVAKDRCDYATARALYEESLAIFRKLDDRRGIATLQINLGIVARDGGDHAYARELFEASLSLARAQGDRHGLASGLNNLAGVAYAANDLDTARELYEESLIISRELGDRQGIAGALNHLGVVVCEQGDGAGAEHMFEEGLAIHSALGDRWGVAVSLEGLAKVSSALVSPVHAARLWGAAERLREGIGCPVAPPDRPRYDREIADAVSASGSPAAFEEAWREGRALVLEQALALARRDSEG